MTKTLREFMLVIYISGVMYKYADYITCSCIYIS